MISPKTRLDFYIVTNVFNNISTLSYLVVSNSKQYLNKNIGLEKPKKT